MSGNSPLNGRMTEHPMTEATPLASEQITQEDREAAASVAHGFNRHILESGMRVGMQDHHAIVQAFARHRITALSASPAPSGQGVSGEVNEPWRVAAWNACRKQGISQEASIGFVKALAEEMALAAPAPSCAPGEVERLVGSARGHLANVRAHGNAEANACMVFERVIDTLAALSPQGLDAKEGGE